MSSLSMLFGSYNRLQAASLQSLWPGEYISQISTHWIYPKPWKELIRYTWIVGTASIWISILDHMQVWLSLAKKKKNSMYIEKSYEIDINSQRCLKVEVLTCSRWATYMKAMFSMFLPSISKADIRLSGIR